jgi:pimeloyl-ACP methyl ester carboxylesterase
MRSSSSLFPVALQSAERRGDLSEDVYRIKAANSPDPSVELAVTRLGLADHPARGLPVILLHGEFGNRRLWFSPRGTGLGAWLARAGFDVWIAEMRGHGLSPRNLQYAHNRVADYARYDLPVIGAFVREKSGAPAHWLGHTQGGVSLAAALGGGYLAPALAASVVLFASQLDPPHWLLKIPPVQWAARALLKRRGGVCGALEGHGPEDEAIGLALERLGWQAWKGRFGDAGQDWLAGLGTVQVPVLAICARDDEDYPAGDCHRLFEHFGSSQRQFQVIETGSGQPAGVGSVDPLVGEAAREQVWPLVGRWLREAQKPLQSPLAELEEMATL